jgi:hypothetical protein
MDRAQPGWRELVHTAEFLPRLTVVERLDLAEDDGELGRPAGSIADLPGVYLVGDWVRSGSWLLDASLASARAAAERVIRRSERRIAA